jgi:hypothetical protein
VLLQAARPLDEARRLLQTLKECGLLFDAFAHRVCTDELPGLGVVSGGRDGLLSLHDADGKCCVYDLLIPV